MSSTGKVRGKGELLRTVAVRLAIVGGLAVAAWLVGAVTANAAEVSARAGDPSPSAVSKQGEQPMDAPVRADTYGPATTDPAASGIAAADQAVSADPAASAYPYAQQSAVADQLPAVPQSSVAGPRLPATPSADLATWPHGWIGAQSWSPLDSRPSARPAPLRPTTTIATPAQPGPSAADLACAQAMADATRGWSPPTESASPAPSGSSQDESTSDASAADQSTSGQSDQYASDQYATDQSSSDQSSSDESAYDQSAYGDSTYAGSAYGEDGSDEWAADNDGSDDATWPSNPVLASDNERMAVRSAAPASGCLLALSTAGTRLDPSPIHVSRVSARSGSPQRALRHQLVLDSTGAPALPRPEPDPQPVPFAPSVPSASASGHEGTGGPRGVLAVLPAQPVPAGATAVDRVRFAGSVAVPGVQDQPITSPD